MTNTSADTRENVLVLGGTGKTGRRAVERLEALDVPVRMGSRSADPGFDWTDETTSARTAATGIWNA